MKNLLFALLLLSVANVARAQDYSADTESVDAIMKAVYDVISGPAGQERDWDRFRNMFAPGAHLIPIQVTPDTTQAIFWTPDEYTTRAGSYLVQNGFFEVEIARKVERYGHILHAFSTYESRRNADDEQPFARGINSFQLMHDGNRWWVVNIMWDSERPGQEIPATYLPN